MALFASQQTVVLPTYSSNPAPSATITVASSTIYGGATAVCNSTAFVVTNTSGNTWTVQSQGFVPQSALITFTSTDPTPVSITIPALSYLPNTVVQTGRSAAQMVATVRNRTNLNFGEPSDTVIVQMINDGIEEVARRLEPTQTQYSFPVANAETNSFCLPLDCERVRDANYSTGSPWQAGTIVYELVQLDYDSFIQETDASPAGGVGGIPTIYSLIQDTSGIMVCQFYPYANTGQFNFNYFKRPVMYTVFNGSANPNSYTDLDALWQGAVILFACSQACENREDYGTADRFYKMYEDLMEQNMLEVKRRVRKRGTNTVRDVSVGESVIPTWMR